MRRSSSTACAQPTLGEVLAPQDFGLDPDLTVSMTVGLVTFLQTAWDEWAATGRTFDALPHVWPVPGSLVET